jgi:hypothetical protein
MRRVASMPFRVGHVQVHQDHVWSERLGRADRFGAGRDLTHQLQLGLTPQHRADAGTKLLVVVGE